MYLPLPFVDIRIGRSTLWWRISCTTFISMEIRPASLRPRLQRPLIDEFVFRRLSSTRGGARSNENMFGCSRRRIEVNKCSHLTSLLLSCKAPRMILRSLVILYLCSFLFDVHHAQIRVQRRGRYNNQEKRNDTRTLKIIFDRFIRQNRWAASK